MKISANVTLAEATKSQTATRLGLDNTPDTVTIQRMKAVAEHCFEPARAHFGVPIHVSSFYRSPALNKAIKGAKNSQHTTGEAMDLDCDTFGGLTNRDLFDWLSANVEFDQLILENPDEQGNPSWVHVSYREGRNRGEKLKAIFVNGKPSYSPL